MAHILAQKHVKIGPTNVTCARGEERGVYHLEV